MASSVQFPSSILLLIIIAAVALISPATSQTCKSQTFNQTNIRFASCTDLPTLRAYLHWTYDPSARPNPTLDIAFIAPPASRDGWIAWALNPTGTGMVGAQSLIAFRDSSSTNGSIVVRTYNISAYSSITESAISYEVLRRRAEYSDSVMRIFATLALPSGHAAELNQVWQVGAAVSNGVPQMHAMSLETLSSKGTLRLGSEAPAPEPATSPTSSSNGGGGTQGGNDSRRICAGGLGLYGGLVLLGYLFLGF